MEKQIGILIMRDENDILEEYNNGYYTYDRDRILNNLIKRRIFRKI